MKTQRKILVTALFLAAVVSAGEIAAGLRADGPYALVGPKNFVTGYPAENDAGTVNVVVEIPAGTTAKWETKEDGNKIEWQHEKGKPRIVRYLGYPGNYGMVPQTLMPKSEGGDGDPLDVIVLGPAVPRGSVIQVRLVGVMRFLDHGEQDDKLLAVAPDTPLGSVRSLAGLNEAFPGATQITRIWFENYKGPGAMQFKGFGDREAARTILRAAMKAYR